MACDVRIDLTEASRNRAKEGKKRLLDLLKERAASIVIDRATGALAIKGWRSADIGMSDACVIRTMLNKPETRGAVLAAIRDSEKIAGRAYNPKALEAGVHSHDGGKTWGPGH